METVYSNKLSKVLLIIACIFTIGAVVSLNNLSYGYEISVYDSIPLFWIFIITSTSITIINIIYQIYTKNYWAFSISFFILLLNNFLIVSLPIIKGYFIYGSNDSWGHFKFARYILLGGHIDTSNYYPITHILAAEITKLANINLETSMKFLPIIFTMIFMIFSYFLAVTISKDKRNAMIVAATSCVLIFSYYHVTVYPQGLSLLLLPLVFYAFFKSEKNLVSETIIFLIFLLLIPFTHVYVAFIFIACLLSVIIFKFLLEKFQFEIEKNYNNVFLISVILFFVWWSSFSVFSMGITKLNNWIFSESVNIPRTADLAPIFDMGLFSWVVLFLKMYGPELILLTLSLIAIFLIVRGFLKNKDLKKYKGYLLISTFFVVTLLAYVLLFVIQGKTTIGRFFGSNLAFWALPILSGFALIKFIKFKKLGAIFMALILITSFTFGALSVYKSDWVLQPNWQLTYPDADTMNWYDQNKVLKENTMSFPLGRVSNIPDHFGYENGTMLGENYHGDIVLIIGEYRQKLINENRILINSPILEVWGRNNITNNDFNILNEDKTVNSIYSNGEDRIVFIRRPR